MEFRAGGLPGLVVFQPRPWVDSRGSFMRTFDAECARAAGVDPAAFQQDSQSRSRQGVVRGLHLRTGAGESKLVRCSYGAVFDVVVDLRRDSASFGRWVSMRLDDTAGVVIYIPAGCAHGFQALTEPADVCYRIDRAHRPEEDVTVRWDDPDLAISWPLPVTALSDRDRSAPSLREVSSGLS